MARRCAIAAVCGEDWRCERTFVWTYVAPGEARAAPESIQRHLSGAVCASLVRSYVHPRFGSYVMKIRLRTNK